jgi:hypothetical protein
MVSFSYHNTRGVTINCYSSLSYIYLCGATLNLDEVIPRKLLMVVKVALWYELWTSLMDLCWILFLLNDLITK